MKAVLFLVLIELCRAFPNESRLSDDELGEYVYLSSAEHERVPEHQIIYIEHVTETSTRRLTHDTIIEDTSSFKFRAFDEDFHVADVTPENDMFTDQTASCNIINSAGVERTEVIPTSCFLRGNVRGHKSSIVSMSTCNGLTASITRLGHTDLYIEPLSDKHAMKRGIQTSIGHIVYRYAQEQPFECVVDDEEDEHHDYANANTRSSLPEMNLKVHVVANHLYYAWRGANSCKCLIAVSLAVAHRLELLPNLQVALNGVDIITSQSVLNTGSNSHDNLAAIEEWVKNHPQKADWDHVALIVSNNMDVAGRAPYCGVCGSSKVSVSKVRSYLGVKIVTHEIGHNICISHNTNHAGCMSGGFIMSSTWYLELEQGWAQCSINEFKIRAPNKKCLTDNA